MISKLFRPKPALVVKAPRLPTVPKGTVVWAIGDVHGRLDLLAPLVDAIVEDARGSIAERKVVIFLGDYIDRGDDSRGVIRFLCDLPQHVGVEWRFLKGNHEQAMLDFLVSPSVGPQWCEYGGGATLRSYGLRRPDLIHRMDAWNQVSADLDHLLTPAERRFLEQLEISVEVGDYFFCHAGARPGVSLEDQSEADLMWIRTSFLNSEVEFEKVIVHGHTPVREIFADHRRLGLDTKAYASGVLSAIRLSGSDRRLIQATGSKRGDDEEDALASPTVSSLALASS